MKPCDLGIHKWKRHDDETVVKFDIYNKILWKLLVLIVLSLFAVISTPLTMVCTTIPALIFVFSFIIFISSIAFLSIISDGDGYMYDVYNKTCLNCHESNLAAEKIRTKVEKKRQKLLDANEITRRIVREKARVYKEKELSADKAYAKNLKRYNQAKESEAL